MSSFKQASRLAKSISKKNQNVQVVIETDNDFFQVFSEVEYDGYGFTESEIEQYWDIGEILDF